MADFFPLPVPPSIINGKLSAIEIKICSSNLLNGFINDRLQSSSSFKKFDDIERLLHLDFISYSENSKGTLSSISLRL